MTVAAEPSTASRSASVSMPVLTGLVTVVLALVAVEVLVRASILNPFVLPPPTAVLGSVARVFVEEDVPSRFATTMAEALGACFLIAVIGVPLGALLHRFSLARQAFEGWVAAWMAAPIVLAYPLFLVLIGRNSMTVVVMAFLTGVCPVVIKTLEGLAGVRRALVKVGRSFNLSEGQLYWKILFPAALPTIFTGIRLGAMRALLGVVGVEFLTNFGGLGQLVNLLAERYDLAGTFAAIIFVIVQSVLFFTVLELAEKRLARRG